MEPFDPFIPRQLEDKELEKILNAFSWGLDKVVDFGSNLVKWDIEIKLFDICNVELQIRKIF